ncbi:MAG: DUF350 domain-containing protein [Myxococcales bacterium]|nr:DUF350 domain-containing protein [Myxococcales bacterium]
MFWEVQGSQLVASILYSLIGVAIFALAFLVVERVAPFSLRKELAEDDNIAVGIVMASVIIGLSMIISAAIGG